MVIPNNLALLSTLPVLVVMSLTSAVEAQQNTTDSNGPEFIAIQDAQSGIISETNSTSYSLQLNDLADKTILFSDRPDRVVTTQSTQDFIGNWTSGQDSFQVDPPNAALVVLVDNDQKEEIFEIELFNPKYEKDEKRLSYDFTFLGNTTTTASYLPNVLGKSVLVIDSLPTAVNDQITDSVTQTNVKVCC